MADNTVIVQEQESNTVTAQDIINAVTVSELDSNAVTVVAATFVNDAGASSKLLYSTGAPSNTIGSEGDFYIDTQMGYLYGPKGETQWSGDPLALIPKRNVFNQEAASASWTLNHNLGGYPSVTVVDSAGTVVIGEVTYIDDETVQIEFEQPFSGYAYLT